MKTSLNLVAVLLAVLASPANAAFIGAYDFANWTKAVNGGSITTDSLTNSVTLISSDNGGGAKNQNFTITAAAAGLVTFDWGYLTVDSKSQAPKGDPFGWLLNGVFTQLTDNKGLFYQFGSRSFAVKAGDVFGFEAQSTNSKFGSAVSMVTNFSGPVPAAVPLPASAWLMVVPLLTLLRKRKVSAF